MVPATADDAGGVELVALAGHCIRYENELFCHVPLTPLNVNEQTGLENAKTTTENKRESDDFL